VAIAWIVKEGERESLALRGPREKKKRTGAVCDDKVYFFFL